MILSFIFLSATATCRAGDADFKLTTANGTTKFTVKDSTGKEVASVTSLGTLSVSSNTILTGTTFYQSGSVVLSVAGQSVTISSNLVVSGAIVANSSAGVSGEFLQSRGPGTSPVWASAAGAKYMGITGSTYDGAAVGGILGANSKCNSAFAGSHMCTQGEILRGGATSLSATAWILCDSINYDSASNSFYCNAAVQTYGNDGSSGHNGLACDTPGFGVWMNNSFFRIGFTVDTNGKLVGQSCVSAFDIHCCQGGVPAATYKGMTATSYDGNLGGITGANTKCQVDYAGSHMCTQSEILRSGATSLSATGWVACDYVNYNTAANKAWCAGQTNVVSSGLGVNYVSCVAWGNNNVQYFGPVVNSSGNFASQACNATSQIHCCQ